MNGIPNPERWAAMIEAAYQHRARRYPDAALGWRLLYSPERVLSHADVAFIGFNPGGHFANPDHGQFSAESGSAYRKEVESWGRSSALQEQVMALFGRLGVQAEDVLAGNLVPFRSPSEKSLPEKAEAILFGRALWEEIFEHVRPSLVVSMGAKANREVSRILVVNDAEKYPTGWGTYTASRGTFEGGTWIGLPHLSRFTVLTRAASKAAMDYLFRGLAQLS